MAKIIYLCDAHISNLDSSGIELTNDLPSIISSCYIAFCNDERGGGISTRNGILYLQKTCIFGCTASLQGSAIYAYAESYVNLTSVCRCADKECGSDDSIDFEHSNVQVFDLNSTRSFTVESCGIQFALCKEIEIKRNIYAHGNGSYVLQHYHPKGSCCNHYNEIFVNNTLSKCTLSLNNSVPIVMKECIFAGNNSPVLFGFVAGKPKITFESVVYMDSNPKGTEFDCLTSTNKIIVPARYWETQICQMIIEQSCLLRQISIGLIYIPSLLVLFT